MEETREELLSSVGTGIAGICISLPSGSRTSREVTGSLTTGTVGA